MSTNFYPSDIKDDIYKNKSVKIFAKGSLVPETIEELSQVGTESIDAGTQDTKAKNAKRTSTMWGCALPLPDELSDSQNHNWSVVNSSMHDIASDVIGSVTSSVSSGIKDKVNTTRTGQPAAQPSKKWGAASKLFDGAAKHGAKMIREAALKSGKRAPMINPGYFQDYSGSNPRGFSLSWTMLPNSRSEADQIRQIIEKFKTYSSPSVIGYVAMLSPYSFDIIIGNDKIDKMMGMHDVVITNMSVDYLAGGPAQFFPDGTPKVIKMTLSFAEKSLKTSDEYKQDFE